MYRRILTITLIITLIFPIYAGEASLTIEKNVVNKKSTTNKERSFVAYSEDIYQKINDSDLDFDAFNYALKGFVKLQQTEALKNSKYLTIIDMSSSANTERFYIINMETQELEHKSLVAHGQKSGLEFAKHFSNRVNSHQTSLGFYKTAETYTGKHGLSLRLDGLEYSNNKARERAVVIHKADYANPEYIKKNGRLGRSYGCPSLPAKDYATIIGKIKEGSCLFIYFPQEQYLSKSNLADTTLNLVDIQS